MADEFDEIMSRGTVVSSIRRTITETGETRSVRTEKPVATFDGKGIAEACRLGCNGNRVKKEGDARLSQRKADVSGEDGFRLAMSVLGFETGAGELTAEERAGAGTAAPAGAGR